MPRRRKPVPPEAPHGFRVNRDLPIGRHPLLAAFPGLTDLETAARQEPDAALRSKLYDETCVEVVGEDLWMYVAPHELPPVPPRYRSRWRPVISPGSDCIVIGEKHLRESPSLILFLDIFHELCHIQQRHDGADLFRRDVSYVDRPTEVDAYRFVVNEARRMGVSDEVLQDYLRVEWIDNEEFERLLKATGVAVPT
jgi:hypothetical protein